MHCTNMEELQKIAEAYYNSAPDSSKKVADDFINEMDEDSDGRITLCEFLNFTKKKNYPYISNKCFFNELNLNRTGTLDRREAMTLFYIVCSGRPFCIGCGNLITTIFFTCVQCFDCGSESPTFDLCASCFSSGSYCHGHNSFIDNFVLLQVKRRAQEEQRKNEIHHEASSSSQAIVPVQSNHNGENIWMAAVKGVIMVGAAIAKQLCTIM